MVCLWVVRFFDLKPLGGQGPGCFSSGHGTLLSRALVGEFDAVGIVDKPVEDGVGDRGITDHVVPMFDGHLTGYNRGPFLIAVLNDLQEVAPLLVAEFLRASVIKDEQVSSGERLQDF